MEMPKLRVRPMSTQTCVSFGGLDRLPGASNRAKGSAWKWNWHDERNLSSDCAPMLSVRPARGSPDKIDGNNPKDAVIAMCGGDKLLLLDVGGNLWCSGHSVYLAGEDGVEYFWNITQEGPNGTVPTANISPDSGGSGASQDVYPIQRELWDAWQGHFGKATLIYDGESAVKPWLWEEDGAQRFSLAELGISMIMLSGATLRPGYRLIVRFEAVSRFGRDPSLIRMGAYAVIYPGWVWCNAEKLASGEEMTEGADYGLCEGEAGLLPGETSLQLTLCDIDGNDYSGVTVSSVEPMQQTGRWLDTSGDKTVLREWSVTQSRWITVTGTYVKIEQLETTDPMDKLRKGDAVTVSVDCAAGTDDEVVKLLNSTHYLYDADLDSGWVLVAGILPDATVNVTIAQDGDCSLSRSMPQLDFLIEAQNRLWGCRYSETDSINEIYASKLGDFRNWSVFQGLSTDSWTASRGTAAPFTGAVALGGYPLFFREESLDKVYPSAAGAHQIVSYALEGVQRGSAGSLVVIDDRLYYKSRLGVCIYNGTMPVRISDNFGDWLFADAAAARHRRKYCICMTRKEGAEDSSELSMAIVNPYDPPQIAQTQPLRLCMVYDPQTGDWHVEDEVWDGTAVTWKDECYYVRDGKITQFSRLSGSEGVEWFAESSEMSVELPEHKWISSLRMRFRLELGAACRIYVSYDDGPWERKASLYGNSLRSAESSIFPRRCDHFRLRLDGVGGCELQSISYRVERSEAGH